MENPQIDAESLEADEESRLMFDIAEMRGTFPQSITAMVETIAENKMILIEKRAADYKEALSPGEDITKTSLLFETINKMRSSPWFQSRDTIESSLKEIKRKYQDIEDYNSQKSS